MKRWCGIITLLIGAVGGGTLSFAAGDVATLEPIQGIVQYRPIDAEWQTVAEVIPVAEGAGVRTDARGLAHLTFFEGIQTDILPGSLVTVSRLAAAEANAPPGVALTLLVGGTINEVERSGDGATRFEVHTPSAVLTVRGTVFEADVTLNGETRVSVSNGTVHVTGIGAAGETTGEREVDAGFSLTIAASGELGTLEPSAGPTSLPPGAPLAPVSCGDGRCEPGEAEVCPLDCTPQADCGDQICGLHEDMVTCEEDCAPHPALGELLHFYWGGMRCEIDPPARFMQRTIVMYWGIGCFDSSAHASAHPMPADYQLVIDDQAADMSNLRQSGPNVHAPDCPWGWNYEIGPMTLSPGVHNLILTETSTDTWYAVSGGHTAGAQVTLACRVIVIGP